MTVLRGRSDPDFQLPETLEGRARFRGRSLLGYRNAAIRMKAVSTAPKT